MDGSGPGGLVLSEAVLLPGTCDIFVKCIKALKMPLKQHFESKNFESK